MKKKLYIQPEVDVVVLAATCQPLLAGSEQLPMDDKEVDPEDSDAPLFFFGF